MTNPTPVRSRQQAASGVCGRKLGVWHNPTADYGFGLGPAGSIAAVTALFALLLAFVPPENKLRNVATVAVVAAVTIGPFVVRDRWGRNLYAQATAEARWLYHRRTGSNLHEHTWFSNTPVERSNLPGLLSQVSVASHESPALGPFAVIHHPVADTVSVVLETRAPGAGLADDHTLDTRTAAWGRWLAAMADEPGLAGVQVVTEAAPVPIAVVEVPLAEWRQPGNNRTADAITNELVEACAGTTATTTWVTVTWTHTSNGRTRNHLTTDVIPARVERLCSELGEAGGGRCWPLTAEQLAATWAGMYTPSRRHSIAANPDASIQFNEVGPVTSVEERGRYTIGNYDTVSLTVGQAPDGEPTATIHERLAKGIDGTVAVRWAMQFRPVTSIEARAWSKSIQRAIETRIALRGDRRQTAADTVADEDATDTAAALARGAALTRVGFTITLTTPTGDDLAGPIERTRAAVAPLSPHLRVMDGVHQTSWVSTLPGAMPIPETLTATEWLNQ